MERGPMEIALSTEVVMGVVMSHLEVEDLLSCRLACKLWNKEASSALRKRSTIMKNISHEEHLLKLEQCMRQSSDFPFSGLNFDQPWLLNSGRARKFFWNYGKCFTSLRLDTRWVISLHYLAPFIDHLSRLTILEIGGPLSYSQKGYLFHSGAGQEDGKILKLASVKTIRILKPCTEVNENVLREVLMAASPYIRIECLDARCRILRALKSAGRLQALSSITFDKDYENKKFAPEMDQLFSIESPSLTRLDYDVGACLSRCGLQEILLSSQNTLKEMHLNGMCLCDNSWDEFPVFTKLTTLSVSNRKGYCHGHVCRGSHGKKFPALKELKLDISYERYITMRKSMLDGLFIVPSVTRIDFPGYFDENGVKILSQWFPNVTEVWLQYPANSCCCMLGGSNPLEIWNVREFKRLEKLRICNWPASKCIDMDSFFTGISSEICHILRKKRRQNLIDSPFNKVFRAKSTILHLESLKQLVVCMESGFQLSTEDAPCNVDGFGVVCLGNDAKSASEIYLRPSFASFTYRGRMESVLKHVLPYVDLEFSPY